MSLAIMAGRGPAPKPRGLRRNTSAPLRGEWVDLEPLEKPVIPVADREWSESAKRLYNAVRHDPISTQYGEADVVALREFMGRYEDLAPNEQRIRMGEFGMTPKGKRDLRWRTPGEVATIRKQGKIAEVRQLRAVADAVEG